MKKQLLSFTGMAMFVVGAFAQPYTYNAANTTNTTTTYTDLGSGGSAITTANNDDANSAATPIGFTFYYGCNSYTDFVLNTNGFIKLGTSAPSATNLFYTTGNGTTGGVFSSTDPLDVDIISAFNNDLEAGTGPTEFRVETSGTAPNRICTIQFKGLRDKITTPAIQYDNIEFQIKLYETTNVVEIVYGTWVASANAASFKTSAVGLKTSVVAVAATKTSATAWSGATFLNSNYTGNTCNHRNSALPDAGRTFRFTPITGDDIALTNVYSLTNMPMQYGSPHIISARLINNNTCSDATFDITLSITGANTFTSTQNITVPAGATYIHSFPGFTSTTVGANTITITVPADGNNTNNSVTSPLVVDSNKYSYNDASAAGNLNSGGATYSLVSRYVTSSSTSIDSIYATISTAAVGFTYGIWDNSGAGGTPGTKLYTSSAQTSAAGLNKIFTGGVTVTDTFYVGVTQTTTTSLGLGIQAETPLRTGTFYYSPDGTTWTDYAGVLDFKNMIDAITSTFVGINELTNNNLFTISPNPNNGKFDLKLNGVIDNSNIDIVDIQGRTILHEENINSNKSFDISSFANGVYYLKLTNEKGVSVKKFIKQN